MTATAPVVPLYGTSRVCTAFSEDAEHAVLSAMLMEAQAIDTCRTILRPGMFHAQRHRRIFAAILAIADRGVTVDPLTLSEEMQQRNELDDAGGKEYIGFLVDAVPTAANVEYHAEIVRSKYEEREAVPQLLMAADLLNEGRDLATVRRQLDGVLDVIAPVNASGRGFRLLGIEEVLNLPPVQYLQDGLIPKGGSACFYGPPSSAKSFGALAVGLSVAAGRDECFGRALGGPAGVVYVVAEGASGIGQRVNAWMRVTGTQTLPPLQFLCESVNLLEQSSVTRFLRVIRAVVKQPLGLITIDTLARCIPGGDENSSQDMGRVIASVDRIRADTGAAVLLVHHTRKDGEVERGSNALRGAMDVMVAFTKDGAEVSLDVNKVKDGSESKLSLELQPAHDSAVLITATNGWQSGVRTMSDKHHALLRSLSRDFMRDGATATEWQKATGTPERSFYRLRSDLVTWGYVEFPGNKRGARYTLTPTGRDIAATLPITAKSLPGSSRSSLPAKRPPLGGAAVAGTSGVAS